MLEVKIQLIPGVLAFKPASWSARSLHNLLAPAACGILAGVSTIPPEQLIAVPGLDPVDIVSSFDP
jgi:hypothetical protein